MKNLLPPLLAIFLFAACKKEINNTNAKEEIVLAAKQPSKFTVCHYDPVTHSSKTIQVTQNALAGHLAHGDLQGDCSAVLTTICDQDWMVKNLDVTTYRNGDIIPQVTDPTEFFFINSGAWCYYNNDPLNGATYGKLYNWYAVNDPRGLAPAGWHIPTDDEWTNLITCLGGFEVAGGKMKSVGTNESATGLWYAPNTGATNSSGFTGLPGGIVAGTSDVFINKGYNGYWWSSTEYGIGVAWTRIAFYDNSFVYKFPFDKKVAISVRCLRNN